MSTQEQNPKPQRMTGVGVKIEFVGHGFPAESVADLGRLLKAIFNPPTIKPKKIDRQPLEAIEDVVVESAMVLSEADMKADEAEFIQRAARLLTEPKPSENEADARIAQTEQGIRDQNEDMAADGFGCKITVKEISPFDAE